MYMKYNYQGVMRCQQWKTAKSLKIKSESHFWFANDIANNSE